MAPEEPENKPVEMVTLNECSEPIKGSAKNKVRKLVGHSTVSTVGSIYCYMLENSRACVSDTISNALDLKSRRSA